jgi:hypothetical protein
MRNYFAYHGHYNQHFWLLTQDESLVWKPLVKFAEQQFRAASQSTRPPGHCMYKICVPGTRVKQGGLVKRFDRRIFSLYKTAETAETEKPRKSTYYYMMIGVGALLVFGAYQLFFSGGWGGGKQLEAKITSGSTSITSPNTSRSTANTSGSTTRSTPRSTPRSTAEVLPEVNWVEISHVRMGESIQIVDPATGDLRDSSFLRYPVRIVRRGFRTVVYADIPEEQAVRYKQ